MQIYMESITKGSGFEFANGGAAVPKKDDRGSDFDLINDSLFSVCLISKVFILSYICDGALK